MSMKTIFAVGIIALVLPGFAYILSVFESLSNRLTDFIINGILDLTPTLLLLGVIFIGSYWMVELLRE